MVAADLKTPSREKLLADLKGFVAEAEEMLNAATQHGGEKMSAAREKFERGLREVKAELEKAQVAMVDRTKEAAKVTDKFVHDSPWQAIGIAAGVGVVIGMLISRR